ncbi:unnamed protein product, partial [Musa acuminata subsp. burmannicoides]
LQWQACSCALVAQLEDLDEICICFFNLRAVLNKEKAKQTDHSGR